MSPSPGPLAFDLMVLGDAILYWEGGRLGVVSEQVKHLTQDEQWILNRVLIGPLRFQELVAELAVRLGRSRIDVRGLLEQSISGRVALIRRWRVDLPRASGPILVHLTSGALPDRVRAVLTEWRARRKTPVLISHWVVPGLVPPVTQLTLEGYRDSGERISFRQFIQLARCAISRGADELLFANLNDAIPFSDLMRTRRSVIWVDPDWRPSLAIAELGRRGWSQATFSGCLRELYYALASSETVGSLPPASTGTAFARLENLALKSAARVVCTDEQAAFLRQFGARSSRLLP